MSDTRKPEHSIDLREYVEEDLDPLPPEIDHTLTLLRLLVQALVDNPRVTQVQAVCGSHSVIFEVQVAQDDIRRVIGRKGRTAHALRDILLNLGAKVRRRFLLEILEPSEPNDGL